MNLLRLNLFCAAASLSFLMGCGQPSGTSPSTSTAPEASAEAAGEAHDHGPGGHSPGEAAPGHSHGAGPHGGTLADWGGGKYHVEFTVDHERREAVVYVLGSDEKTVSPVKTADGKLLLSISDPAFQVELKAAPPDGETEGAASRYVGQHESLGLVREFAGTISGVVDGIPYAADFAEEPHAEREH